MKRKSSKKVMHNDLRTKQNMLMGFIDFTVVGGFQVQHYSVTLV